MKKIILLPFIALLATTSGVAAANLYVGAGVGYVSASAEYRADYSPEQEGLDKADIAINDVAGQFFAEFGAPFDACYIGVIVSYDYGAAKGTKTTTRNVPGPSIDGRDQYEIKYNYSFSGGLKAGYFVTPKSLIYFTVGIVRTNWESSVGNDAEPEKKVNKKFNELGFRPSIGVDIKLNNKFKVGVEASFTYYPKDITTVKSFGNQSSEHKVSPASTMIMFTLAYNLL